MADISRKKVSSVVIHCVQSGYLTLESFNDIIQTISYTDAHKNNQSQSVKIKPLNQFRVKTDCMWNGEFIENTAFNDNSSNT